MQDTSRRRKKVDNGSFSNDYGANDRQKLCSVHHLLSDESAMRGTESPFRELNCVRPMPSAIAPPAVREIHLWSGLLDSTSAQRSGWQRLLSANELQRAEQFHFATDRYRYIVRRGMLRTILARYLLADPRAVQFQRSQHGKLSLAGEFALSKLDFSLTHSQDRSLVAVASGQRLGVDLECVRRLSDLNELVNQCLSPSEKNCLGTLSSTDQLHYFYRYWTGKEACLKASGEGLTRRLDSVRLDWATAKGDGVAEARDTVDELQTWFVRSFSPFDGYLAAIACAHRPARWQYFTSASESLT
jgi:4'-phosphopantetheinyl transferase